MKKLFIIGFAALLLVAFTVPAMAKVKIGGIVFTDVYYIDRNAKNAWWHAPNATADQFDSYSPYQVLAVGIPGFTRLNARWTNEDNVGMFIELGLGQGGTDSPDLSSSNGVTLRHAYGWWDVNPNFQILAGKTFTGFSPLSPSQTVGYNAGSVNIIGLGYGNWDWGRWAMVRGTYKFGMGRVNLALVDPNGGQRNYNSNSMGDTESTLANFFPAETVGAVIGRDYQNNTKLPDFNLSAVLNFGPISLYPGFLYQYRTVDYLPGSDYGRYDDSVSSYAGTLGAKGGFGPFGFAVEGNWGQNIGNTRSGIGNSPSTYFSSATFNEDGYMNNSNTYSFWADVWYKVGPVTPHVMYGQQKTSVDYNFRDYSVKTSFWGFSIPIDLAKGFRVRPEFMWYDDGELEAGGTNGEALDFGNYAIYGVQFQITF